MTSKLDRVREAASRDRSARFTALFHHLTPELLASVFAELKPQAAPGVDDVRWDEYELDLDGNIADLLNRLHRGTYRPKPVRRRHIPKPDGGTRPLGIATVEDKLLQRATAEILNAIYETDFRDFSYGFRPARSTHDALDALAFVISKRKVSWVLDADIKSYFDSIDHELLMRGVEHRIGDPRILRLIRQWLSAGVMEGCDWVEMKEGTPQGAPISPLLANIFLHYAFDQWADGWRRRTATGEVYIARYADDFIVCFQRRADADRFLADLRVRMGQCRLSLHPEKTRLLQFGRFAANDRRRRGEGHPETFDFLGFTHICGKNKNGGFLLRRQTIAKRVRKKLRDIKQKLRARMHDPIPSQGLWLGQVLRGYCQAFAVPTNLETLRKFRTQLAREWHRTLSRRSQKGRVPWSVMQRRIERWLPPVHHVHPWPDARFARRYPAYRHPM